VLIDWTTSRGHHMALAPLSIKKLIKIRDRNIFFIFV